MSETTVDPAGIPRAPTGEIKNQSPTPTTTPAPTTTEAKPAEVVEPAKPEDKPSLLNQKTEVPEKYEAFKAPEGFEITEDATKELGTLFKDLGLSQIQGQKLVDFYAAKTQELVSAPMKMAQETRAGWQKQVIDQYGSKLGEMKTTVSRAIDSVLGPKYGEAFREALDYTGAGDHPDIINALNRFAERLSEGTHVRGNGPTTFGQRANNAPLSAAKAMYPNLPSSSDR